MRNLSFYTTTYLNTRLDMHEKAVAAQEQEEKDLEKKLLDLQSEKTKLIRELTKMRELGTLTLGQESTLKTAQGMMNEVQTTDKPVSAGGRGGAGSKANLYLNLKTPQDYRQISDNYESLGFTSPEQGMSILDSQIASAHSQRVLEAIGEGKFSQAYEQMAKMVPEMMRVVPEDRRKAVMNIMNEHLSETAPELTVNEEGKFLRPDAALKFKGTAAESKPGVQAAAKQQAQRVTERFTQDEELIQSTSAREKQIRYDPRVYGQLQSGIDRLSEDIDKTDLLLQESKANKLEFELGPGYRPFAPMFANIRAQRAQLRAMRGMSPEDKQVYGLTYDYLKNNRNFAEDSSAMQIASKMEPANSADLLNKARQQAQSGSASVDDIIQAYIQIKQAASQGQASLGMIAADAATEEVASNLQASVEEEVRLVNEVGSELDRAYIDSQSIVSSGPKEIITEEPDTSTAGNFRESPFPDDQHLMVLNDDGSDTYRDAGTGETYQVKNRNTRTKKERTPRTKKRKEESEVTTTKTLVPIDTYTRIWAANPGMTKEKYDSLSSEEKAALDKLYGP